MQRERDRERDREREREIERYRQLLLDLHAARRGHDHGAELVLGGGIL